MTRRGKTPAVPSMDALIPKFAELGIRITYQHDSHGAFSWAAEAIDPKDECAALMIREVFGADAMASRLGGSIAYAEDGMAILLAPREAKTPEEVASSAKLVTAVEYIQQEIKAGRVERDLALAIGVVFKFTAHRRTAASVEVARTLGAAFKANRSLEAQHKAKRRVLVNAEARSKAEAKDAAEVLFNEWMDTKPRRTWTNEQFAMEALNRWKGKIASVGVVAGWIPAWKRSRNARMSK